MNSPQYIYSHLTFSASYFQFCYCFANDGELGNLDLGSLTFQGVTSVPKTSFLYTDTLNMNYNINTGGPKIISTNTSYPKTEAHEKQL